MYYLPKELWTEQQIIAAYYWHLNDHIRFRDELRELFQNLIEPAAELERLDGAGLMILERESWPYQPTGLEHDEYFRVYDKVRVMLSDFCNHWHLPHQHGMGDLAWSFKRWQLRQAQGHDDSPSLITGGRSVVLPPVGLPVPAGSISFKDISLPVIKHIPIIVPNVPLPFIFDPTEQSRKELNRRIEAICREIRESILNQVEAYERQAKEGGLYPKPSRMTPAQVMRIGRAIYRRAVLRWDWKKVYQEYNKPEHTYKDQQEAPPVSAKSVDRFAERIREWADKCGIPL